MATALIPSDVIPPLLQDAGLLTGLLLPAEDSQVALDFDWFTNIVAELQAIPSRRPERLALLRGLLGHPAPQAPPGQSWYALPLSGAPTPIYAVLPADDSGDSATLGVGILDLYTRGK